MAASTGQLFSTRSIQIEEVINNNVDVILPGLDPAWMDTIVSNMGVGSADAIGRDMEIIRLFQTGMTGVLEQNNPAGDWALYGDAGDQAFGPRLHTQSLVNSFPDPTGGANQTPYNLGIPMRAQLANIMFTLGELQAEATPAFIGQVIAPKLEGFSRNMSNQLCNQWYISQNLSYQLSGIKANTLNFTPTGYATGYDSDDVYHWTFEPDNEACDRYYPGQRIDFFATGFGADSRKNEIAGTGQRIPVFVESVDELTNTVWCVSEYDPTATDGASTGLDFESTLAVTDLITLANQGLQDNIGAASTTPSFTGIAGINSWMKDGSDGTLSGTPSAGSAAQLQLLGGEAISGKELSVGVHPEHKSLGYNLSGSVLTEHTLRQLLRRFHAAKNKYGYYIDTLIASEGLWMAYEGTRIGRETIERSDRLGGSTPNGYVSNENFGGQTFTMDGRTYTSYTSCYVDDGVMYGIRKGGNNWKRYVPPDIKNSKPFDRNAPFIPFRFVAGALTGLGTNQLPIYTTGSGQMLGSPGAAVTVNRVTEGSQMPGWLRIQLVPEQFCGMVLKNCATSKIYGDF